MSFDIGSASGSKNTSVPNASLTGDANSITNGPHVTIRTNADAFPVYQQLVLDHDNISMNFDAYQSTAGSWLSGYYDSQFQIEKANDRLAFNWSAGVSQGNTLTWNTGLAINNSGGISIGNGTAFNRLLTGSHSFGTTGSTIGTHQTSVTFGQTLPSSNYTVLLSPEVAGNSSEVFSVTPSAKSTTGFTANVRRVDIAGGTWGNALTLNWTVLQ
jgi:hypothetical protein